MLPKLQPYRLLIGCELKPSPKFNELFEVVKKTGDMAYRLLLPKESQVHPVFPVFLLKKYVARKHIILKAY